MVLPEAAPSRSRDSTLKRFFELGERVTAGGEDCFVEAKACEPALLFGT